MAEYEAELLLLGIWENIADLEEKINLPELFILLDTSRKQRHEQNKFLAALKGIDLDKEAGGENDIQERFDAIQDRVNRRLHGDDAVDRSEYFSFGLDLEVEE